MIVRCSRLRIWWSWRMCQRFARLWRASVDWWDFQFRPDGAGGHVYWTQDTRIILCAKYLHFEWQNTSKIWNTNYENIWKIPLYKGGCWQQEWRPEKRCSWNPGLLLEDWRSTCVKVVLELSQSWHPGLLLVDFLCLIIWSIFEVLSFRGLVLNFSIPRGATIDSKLSWIFLYINFESLLFAFLLGMTK